MKKIEIHSTCYIGDDHKYFDIKTNEELNVRSATDLINMIYPFDYSSIPPAILEAAQIRGTCVHNRLEKFIKEGKEGICEHNVYKHELLFKRAKQAVIKLPYDQIFSEISLYNDYYSGTFDLLTIKGDEIRMYDFKTSSKPSREKEMLQMVLYKHLLEENFGITVTKFGVINPNVEMYYWFTENEEIEQEKNYETIMVNLGAI